MAEWMAFADLEPWGTKPADLRAGIVASTIANTAFGTEKRNFQPSDFMPQYDAPRVAAPRSIAAALIAKFKAMGAVEVPEVTNGPNS